MKTKIAIGILAITVILAWSGLAGAQTAPSEPDKIKALLVRPAGWTLYWTGCLDGDSAESELIFEVQGEKVVVRIYIPPTDRHGTYRCEHEVGITSDGCTFSGCRDPKITMLFDPGDNAYPFKGKGVYCSESVLSKLAGNP